MPTEADTCRENVTPALIAAGWNRDPHSIAEQRTFTDGRIFVAGEQGRRGKAKRADYLLRYTRDFTIAVVEAKAEDHPAGEGMQQAKEYAEILGLSFAYASNGREILEFDFLTGLERRLDTFPTPAELWDRLRAGHSLDERAAERVLAPFHLIAGKTPRYYQEIAINRAVQAIAQGKRRVLLTLATGTGKTLVAFQICWKLWSSRWNRAGIYRHPKILYLADRNLLVDDPKDKMFLPFGDARAKIGGGEISKGRGMYFAIYQAIAEDERRPGLYREFPPDFFDLVVVDECHRGAASDESRWREILEYFEPAYQLGMTATPRRDDNADSYAYFGNPVYQYSLRQGIEDGFLAPYRVHRVISSFDSAGWRPRQGDLDRYGREIPDREYGTRDFERAVALRARTEAIARHLTEFLKETDRFAKTIVFCVDQEHADEMRRALGNLNADLVRKHPDYVARVTSDEGTIGRGHLSRFQEPEETTPVILTTSHLLTTGMNAPTCRNVVLARWVGSMTEFKQIIGRGTRVEPDYGKLFFNILDYTGSATALFANPSFDGYPAKVIEQEVDESGTVLSTREADTQEPDAEAAAEDAVSVEYAGGSLGPETGRERRKYFYDGGQGEIVQHLVYDLSADGKQQRVVKFTDYTAEKVRTLYRAPEELHDAWADPGRRKEVVRLLAERGIDFGRLASVTRQPEADPFDLLCHLAFGAPVRTRRERAERVRMEERKFFARYSAEARQILDELLDRYAEVGPSEFTLPHALQVPPVSTHGNVVEIAAKFGGAERLREALYELQNLLYAA
ncbi:MAG: DEAD/DEAH box helicase family protein [Gemmatimonadetes bacterium]|nr:DEAD/DEAH box helicase family protein [Gemmatimonadota bacterium]